MCVQLCCHGDEHCCGRIVTLPRLHLRDTGARNIKSRAELLKLAVCCLHCHCRRLSLRLVLSLAATHVPIMLDLSSKYRTVIMRLTVNRPQDFISVISVFRRHIDEICAVLGYYGYHLSTFRGTTYRSHLQEVLEDGADTLSRNVGRGLP
jgi:hypothetical protein